MDFARALAQHGARLLASGGTAAHLKKAGLEVTAIEEWTGFPELLGRPREDAPPARARADPGAALAPGDLAALAERAVEPIDLVAVTLYPFEQRAPKLEDAEAVEEIDIGGVALLRAAAKNYADVIVIHDPAQYGEILRELESGGPSLEQRRALGASRRSRARRATTRPSPRISAAALAADEPPPVHAGGAPAGAHAALRRESAPGGRALRPGGGVRRPSCGT